MSILAAGFELVVNGPFVVTQTGGKYDAIADVFEAG